jgi:peptidoglycan L-alanyl-D-glutamate endopeptidase CwlK
MRDINTLHPYVRQKAEQLKAAAKAKYNLNIIITECLRTNDEQRALYAQGRSPLDRVNALRKAVKWAPITAAQNKFTVTNAAAADFSYHGYGLAFDIAVVDPTGKIIDWSSKSDWNDDDINDWLQVGELSYELGLEWGGNWSSRPDMPHYQYTFGRTIASLRADPNVIAEKTVGFPMPVEVKVQQNLQVQQKNKGKK